MIKLEDGSLTVEFRGTTVRVNFAEFSEAECREAFLKVSGMGRKTWLEVKWAMREAGLTFAPDREKSPVEVIKKE